MEGANNPSPYPHALTQDEGRPKGGPLYLAGRGQEANLIDSARPVPRPSAISYADVRLSIHHRQVQKGQSYLAAQYMRRGIATLKQWAGPRAKKSARIFASMRFEKDA
jgi:hypothetical protein